MNIPKKQHYTTPENSILNYLIYEYDMNKSGLSLLREFTDIPKEILDDLDRKDKLERNIGVGNLMKENKEYKKAVEGNITEVMDEFYRANELSLENVVSIKRDSVFTTKQCKILKLNENISYKLVDIYGSFYRFGEVEFYWSTTKNKFVYKGIGKEAEETNLFLTEFSKLIKKLEKSNKENRFILLSKFRKNYCDKKFSLGMYRELNPTNKFRIEEDGLIFLSDSFDDLKAISGIYNYTKFIVPLIKIFT